MLLCIHLANPQMGTSLSAWRAAIGTFVIKSNSKESWLTPNQKFYDYSSFCTRRREWAQQMKYYKASLRKNACINFSFALVVLPWLMECVLLISNDVHPNPGPTMGHTFANISICHSNIRSLKQICYDTGEKIKLNDIKCHLTKYDIITVSETWLTPIDTSDDYELLGYQKPFRRDRTVHSGPVGYGGVLAWVSDRIACKRRSDLERDDMEAMWLEVRSSNKKLFVCTIYRTASNSDANFWDNLQEMLTPLYETNSAFVLIGDFNACPTTTEGRRFSDFVNSNSLVAFIHEPTRITEISQSLVDQIVTNRPSIIRSTDVEPPISVNDHCNISASIVFEKNKQSAYKRLMWDYKNADFKKFRSELSKFDWDTCVHLSNDIDESARLFTESFLSIAKRIVPNKTVTVRPNDKPWYNNELRNKRRDMLKLYRLAKNDKKGNMWVAYQRCRNTYMNDIRRAKLTYENTRLKSLACGHKTSKQWWKVLKQVGKMGNSNASIPPIEDGNDIVTNDKNKAEIFNTFFQHISRLNDSGVDVPREHRMNNERLLSNVRVTESDILDQLSILDTSKAYGPDGIPPKLLREAGNAIAKPLCQLFNMSLVKKQVPLLWKQSNVMPVFKKDNPSNINNYRPIALLSVVNKVFERIIHKHIYNHLRDNFILSDYQSGFQPGRSCITQLVEIYHKFCQAIDSGKEIRAVFLDISKAFDRVWHRGLLHKLYLSGIDGDLLSWLTNYLTDRTQRVVINGQHSSWVTVTAGVPQGSVLGPLLFLIYINDIIRCISHVNTRLFADDTCMFVEVDNRHEAAANMNDDLCRVKSWADKWLVNFSAAKTKVLTISNKPDSYTNPPICFDQKYIAEVKSHTYLGVELSMDLKWHKHINEVCSKARQKLNAMLPLKYKMDRKTLQTMYVSFVQSSLEYAAALWGGTHDVDIQNLDKIQIDGMRLITGATKRSNINLLYKETGFLSTRTRVHNAMLKLMYNIFNGNCPDYLNSLFTINMHLRYNFRSQRSLQVPHTRLDTFFRSFIPYASRLWNKLSDNVKNAPTVSIFKRLLNPKFAKNDIYFHGERWASVHHARIRMGCSKLKGDLHHNLHVICEASCPCGYHTEDAQHFLLDCKLYDNERESMHISVSNITDMTLQNLLYGNEALTLEDNKKVFNAVHNFIKTTNRFV